MMRTTTIMVMMMSNNDDYDSVILQWVKTHIETCVISGRHPDATISTKSIEI